MCLANLAAMAQVCKGIHEHFGWIIDSMDKKVDLSSYVGSSPGEHTPADPQPHNITVRQQLLNDLSNPDSSVLIDTLGRARDAMELINNGLFSSMEYNAATMVASKHHGRKVVLNHCNQSKESDHIEQLENTKYNDEALFGEMPLSSHCLYWL